MVLLRISITLLFTRKQGRAQIGHGLVQSVKGPRFSYYSPIKIRYFNGNRRALRVGAFPKNPTRRWRYQNKTIVLFLRKSQK